MRIVTYVLLCSFAFNQFNSAEAKSIANTRRDAIAISGETPHHTDYKIKKRDDSRTAFFVSLPVLGFGVLGTILGFTKCTQDTCTHSVGFKATSLVSLVGGALWAIVSGSIWADTERTADPVAEFKYSGDSNYTPTTVHFDASKSSDLGNTNKIRKWKWNFGDGQTIVTTIPTVDHLYTASGNLNVMLTVEDDEGDEATTFLILTLEDGYPAPIFACQITSPIPYAPLNVSCDASASHAQFPGATLKTYEWNFQEGKGFQNLGFFIDSYHIENPGIHAFELRLTDSVNLQKTETQNFQVPDGSPVTNLSISYDNIYHSAPLQLTFDGSASHTVYPGASMVKYLWNLPGEAPFERLANETQIITRHYQSPGTYQATLSAYDNSGRNSTNIHSYILQSPNPIVEVTYSLYPNEYTPTTITLDPNSSKVNYPNTTIVSYAWSSSTIPGLNKTTYPADGRISASINQSGPHTILLTVTDNEGRKSSKTINLALKNGFPIASFDAYTNYRYSDCEYQAIDFDASDSYDPGTNRIVEYRWYYDGILVYHSDYPQWTDYFLKDIGSGYSVHVQLQVIDSNGQISDRASTRIYISYDSCNR